MSESAPAEVAATIGQYRAGIEQAVELLPQAELAEGALKPYEQHLLPISQFIARTCGTPGLEVVVQK
jgi:hypothetical protein